MGAVYRGLLPDLRGPRRNKWPSSDPLVTPAVESPVESPGASSGNRARERRGPYGDPWGPSGPRDGGGCYVVAAGSPAP